MKTKLLLMLVALLLAGGAAYGLWRFNGGGGEFFASGLVEADDIHVGSKVGGRVLKVAVKRGQSVKAGDLLVELEAQDLKASLAEARAMQRQAEARLALLNAGFRREEIDQAEAAAKQAQAELDQLTAGPRQQELAKAEAEWQAARAQADNARKFLQRMEDLAKRELIAKQEYDDAVTKADEAAQKAKAAREQYELLRAGTRKEELERARQKLAEADARRRQLRAGFRQEEIIQVRAEVDGAKARVELLRVQLGEALIIAPVDAQVESLDLEPGDLIGAGKPWRRCCAAVVFTCAPMCPRRAWAACRPAPRLPCASIPIPGAISPVPSGGSAARANLPRATFKLTRSGCCKCFKWK